MSEYRVTCSLGDGKFYSTNVRADRFEIDYGKIGIEFYREGKIVAYIPIAKLVAIEDSVIPAG